MLLSAIAAVLGGALCGLVWSREAQISTTGMLAMAVVLTLPHHPSIIDWNEWTLEAASQAARQYFVPYEPVRNPYCTGCDPAMVMDIWEGDDLD